MATKRKKPRRNFKKSRLRNCSICLKEQTHCIQLTNCDHMICRKCLYKYIENNLKDISKYPMKCFHYDCNKILHLKDVKYAFKLKKNNKSLQIYERFSILCAIPDGQRLCCPQCQMLYFFDANNQLFGYCADCKFRFCFDCNKKWHPGKECKNKNRKDENILFIEKENKKLFDKMNWMSCPQCGIMIEKTDGCNCLTHKKCPKTGYPFRDIRFCYCCGIQLSNKSERYDTFGNIHFKNGSYYDCINGNKYKQQQRQKKCQQYIYNYTLPYLPILLWIVIIISIPLLIYYIATKCYLSV